MAKKIRIKHEQSGMMKDGYFGFSWTYFFFGAFVPMVRGEIGVGCLHLIFNMLTLGLWQIIVCFLYNKQYMTRMLQNGWTLDETDEQFKNARSALGFYEKKKVELSEATPA